MVMFVISGIATHTEHLFADTRLPNTCSFCGHNIRNIGNSHFSKQNRKNECRFCGHSHGNSEYNREEDEYNSRISKRNYDDKEIGIESRDKHSGTKKKKNKGKYALDLRGVHFYDEDIESFESEEDNMADYDGQGHHVRSLDDGEEYSDSSYGDESDNYDTDDENDESDNYDESDDNDDEEEEDQEEEDQSEEDNFENDNEETENAETDQLPVLQQPQLTALPTVPTGDENVLPTYPDNLQYPALPQTPQYPALDQQNQLGIMDPNTLANQYPYGQQNIENMNVNMQPNQPLQAGQYGINDMNNGAYGQMNGASMMPQYGNADINQQDYASVVNETIEYLRNLGILDENRVSKMSAGMVDGECIICMRPKFVFQIRGQGMRGVCEDCLRSRDSYGGAFGAGGIKGVLEKGVMSLFGGGNDDNRGGSGNNGIRSYGSGGGYDDSGGGYYRNPYNNGEMVGNGTPSPVGTDSLRSIANKLTGTVGGGLGGIFGAGNNIFGNGTNGFTGSGGQQMVMNAAGQLVPIGSDPSAPYGYVKDPTTGQMRPATSPEEGLAAGAAAAAAGATTAPGVMNGITTGGGVGAAGQQMVMNAAGQLVPMGSDPSAPYGYVKDPTTGQMRLATSPEEGLAAGAAAAAAGTTTAPGVINGATAGTTAGGIGGTGGQQMVMNAAGQLVPMGSDPSAPYGYVKDPTTGQMRLATSPEEGLAAGAAAGATTATGVINGATAGTMGTTAIGIGGTGGQQMVMNAAGQLVPMGSDPNAPYGYVKDPTTGQMRPATSAAEGLAAGTAAANGSTGSGQMVLNAAGQLVPIGSDPSAPYGYVKDPTTGQMRPATSAAEGLAAGTAATSGSTGSGQMVMNAAGQLVPMGSDPNAPYGYVKDPITGQMRPATSPEEGLAAGAAAAAGTTNGVTGAVASVTDKAIGATNTAVNAANNAAATANQVANSAEAIKNAAQPLTSLVSSIASGIKSKTSSRNDNSSIDSGSDNSRQTVNEQSDTSNSNNQSGRKKKKRKSNNASADGSSGSNSGTQQQSSKKKKKQKDSTASDKDTSGTQQSTKRKKKSSKAT